MSPNLLPSEAALLGRLKNSRYTQNELNSIGNANLFVNSSLLKSAIEFIREEVWLSKNDGEENYKKILSDLFQGPLLSIQFLEEYFQGEGEKELSAIQSSSKIIEEEVLESIIIDESFAQKSFLIHALKKMLSHFLDEEEREGRGVRLYRTFEFLDKIFNLNYQLDKEMVVDFDTPERLYQGSGVNVQSGYSTILLALSSLDLKKGQTFIDLGSGYGRVGLVGALLRPEVNFIGYEYVKHRVDSGNQASERLDLHNNLNFITQDLSLDSFEVPSADVYYMYDPFSKETYVHVLNQLEKIGSERSIKIVTKGNARQWLTDLADKNNWPEPLTIDDGNLCIFKSA